MEAIHRSRRETAMTANTAVFATASTPQASGAARTGSLSTRRVAAAFLMVAGIGWNAGLEARPFRPLTTGVTALVIHVLPLAALMFVALRAQRRGLRGASQGRGVSIAAVVALAFGAFSALFGITHPHAVMGIHDINDVLPIAILEAGALLGLVPGRRTASRSRIAG
jgi:hypothetical protein